MKKQFFWTAAFCLTIMSGSAAGQNQASPLLSIEEYDQIAKEYPNFAPVYFERGMALFGGKDYSKAVQDLNKAVELRPHDADAYYMRGAVYLAAGKFDQAIADLDQAADLRQEQFAATDRMRGNLYLARAYAGSGNSLADSEAALASFDQLVHLEPDSAEAYYERGRAYFAKAYFSGTSFELAIADFDKAINMKPNFEAAKKERESALHNQELFKKELNLE